MNTKTEVEVTTNSYDKKSFSDDDIVPDMDDAGKANYFKLFSIRRPHMRAFHFAWMASFLATFNWFAVAPLLKGIRDRPETSWLTDNNFRIQNAISVAGPILSRVAMGPIVDRFGPRFGLSGLFLVFSVPVFLLGTSQTFWQWAVARFFISFIAADLVASQVWTSSMFSAKVIGTANSTAAGWGNMGAGVGNVLMPQVFNLIVLAGASEDVAWRVSMVFPALLLVLMAILIQFFSDDLPNGNYKDLQKSGQKKTMNPLRSLKQAACNWRVWILFTQIACSFGVEVLINGNLATYMQEMFHMDQGSGGLMVGLFGLINIVASSLGGIASDAMCRKFGIRGRIGVLFISSVVVGVVLFGFSRIRVVGAAIAVVLVLSVMVLFAGGAAFSITPFIDPEVVGAVNGFVGAGSSIGAVIGNILLGNGAEGMSRGFMICGLIVVGVAFLVLLLLIDIQEDELNSESEESNI